MSAFEIQRDGESYTIAYDFTNSIPTGAALSSGTVQVIDRISGDDVTNTVVGTTVATVDSNSLKARVDSTTPGRDYDVRFLATLDNTDKAKASVRLYATR